jgi:hypothetical protein
MFTAVCIGKFFMSEEQQYNVVYAGAIGQGFDESQVKSCFVAQLKIPEDKVEQFFSGKHITLKKSLSKQKAEQWQQKLLKIGAETAIVPSITYQKSVTPTPTPTPIKITKQSQPVSKSNEKKTINQLGSQTEYDEDMNARILNAKAMITTQQMEQQLKKNEESRPLKKLVIFIAILGMLLFFLYFYAESIA